MTLKGRTVEKTTPPTTPKLTKLRTVYYISNRNLDKHEIALLERGLNLHIHGKPVTTLEIAPIAEPLLESYLIKKLIFFVKKHLTFCLNKNI